MSDAVTLTVCDAGVATVELNRPEAGNALNTQVKDELLEALRKVAQDEAVRAVILTGAGRTFCVGQDLGELNEQLRIDPRAAGDTVDLHYNPITLLLGTMPKPVIAGVNGTCVGAGLGFALACDLQVWAESATLATAFTKVGLTTDSGLSATLVRAVGTARAKRLLFEAEPFTVDQAIGWGFAGDVVASDEVATRAREIALRLAAGPTLALAATKRLVGAAPYRDLATVLAVERDEQVALGLTHDHAAAVAAFLARETPVFSGN